MKRILKQLGMNKTGKSKELLDYIFFNLNKIKNKYEDKDIAFIFFTQWAIDYAIILLMTSVKIFTIVINTNAK